ncbi:MAG: hypothetical protein OSA51_04530 [Octadecabacter sp.]|nr:hypothetical protein [Octadecabacter sp.]
MQLNPDTSPTVNLDNSIITLSNEARAQIASLAVRQHNVTSVLIQVVTFLGGQVEDGLKLIPSSIRIRLEAATTRGLRAS